MSYAVEGRNFHEPQGDTAWLFLTVFIALTGFHHEVFPLWPDVRDSPTAPSWRQAANATALSWGTAYTASISLHGQCDPSHCTGTNSRFRWTLQYFVYCRAKYFRVSPLTASLPLFSQGGARNMKFSITKPTTSTQARTLHQSTSRDGFITYIYLLCFLSIKSVVLGPPNLSYLLFHMCISWCSLINLLRVN